MEVGRFYNAESMDLKALYQQDIDLGVNWPVYESMKGMKEVSFEQKPSFDPQDCFVDSETGEYLPIPQKDENEQKQIEDETGQVDFNIEDFLDSNMNSGALQSKELWDDIASLSEAYLALDSGEFAREGTSEKSSPMDENVQFQPVNHFQSDVFGTQIQIPDQQKTPGDEHQYFNMQDPYHTFPTPPYVDQSEPSQPFAHPTSVAFPPDNDKSYGHVDLEEANLSDMLLTEQNELLVQLENVSQISMGNSHPPPLPAEEITSPGNLFFGGDAQTSDFTQVLTDLDMMNNLQNQSGPYMNPPTAPYVPPPIGTSQGMVSSVSDSESFNGEFGEVALMDIEMNEVEPSSVLMPAEQNLFSMPDDGDKDVKTLRKLNQRESRDLKKARELNITLTLDQIVNSPVEEYNELLSSANLNQVQQALVRDIRRRGKNKVAAQNCRKRKIETISSMEIDIDNLNSKRQELLNKQKELEALQHNTQAKYNQLYQQIFNSLRDESGQAYDQSRFSLQQVEGAIILVPGSYGNKMKEGSSKPESKGTVAFFDLSKVKIEKEI